MCMGGDERDSKLRKEGSEGGEGMKGNLQIVLGMDSPEPRLMSTFSVSNLSHSKHYMCPLNANKTNFIPKAAPGHALLHQMG